MSEAALEGLRVLELGGGVAAAYCTKLWAGFGAEVIKIEPPEGDTLRREQGVPFLWLNTGKKSVTLDLRSSEGAETLRRLVAESDVVVCDLGPGVLEQAGLGWESLRAVQPSLVLTSITPFGSSGPYRDWSAEELTLYAMSGGMSLTGSPDREPLGPGPLVVHYTGALWAYVGSLSALLEARRTGRGRHVEVSLQECGVDTIEIAMTNFLHDGRHARRAKHPMVPWDIYPCRDGWAVVMCGPFRRWTRGAELFEEPGLLVDELRHVRERHHRRAEVEALIQPWIERHTRAEIFEAGQRHKLAFGYLASFDEVLRSPQLRSRGFFERTEHPQAGAHEYAGAPFRMNRTPWRQGRAPLLGEHNAELTPPSEREERKPGRALEGLRVVDLGHSWAAPHGTRVLADLGAEVLRVEYVERLCMVRGGRVDDEMYNKHPMWLQVNRGKRSVTLDFNDAGERAILLDLLRVSDVLVECARGGVLERLGLGWDDLHALNPRLIVLSMSAFGRTGPHAERAGYGGTLEALGGIQNLTGYRDTTRPSRIKEVDITNGLAGTCAVLTALAWRERTGHGQWIDMSQLESAIHTLIGEHLLEFVMHGSVSPKRGNRHERHAPQGCYRCAGEDRWVVLSVRTDDEWRALAETLGDPELSTAPRFTSAAGRHEHHDELDRRIEAWTATREAGDVARLLQARGIAAGPVLDVRDLAADAHLQERQYFVEAESAPGPRYPGCPVLVDGRRIPVRWPGPVLGRDNAYARKELLGHGALDMELDVTRIGTAFDP